MATRHSLYHRLLWSPFAVALPLAWFIYSATVRGFTPSRTIGLVVGAVWFVMSVIDLWTKHALLDWLYAEPGVEPPGDRPGVE